jgi:hypothetical protein
MTRPTTDSPSTHSSRPTLRRSPGHRLPSITGAAVAVVLVAGLLLAGPEAKGWTDDALVASFADLESRGALAAAVLDPALPHEAPQTAFLDALAWYAAGAPNGAGTLTLDELDRFVKGQSEWYIGLLREKVEHGAANDYGRTRTWKVIQKLTLLRNAMSAPPHDGSYSFPAISQATAAGDPWENEHTLDSPQEFRDKVCSASLERPVLVKFGNTNCTQCMLFEMIGSVKELADSPRMKDRVDVYKVWWGMRPDETFAGRIPDPVRLDELAKAEGVSSSPYFIVYRNGRRYPCGGAFPDQQGSDAQLEACVQQEFAEAPESTACSSAHASAS